MVKKKNSKINFDQRGFKTSALSKIMPSIMKKLGNATEAKKAASIIRVLNHWVDIMGHDMAPYSTPLRIGFKKQKDRNTGEQISIRVLKIKADSAIATKIAMREQIILQRVNTLFGTDDFQKLDIEQGRITLSAKPKSKTPAQKYDLDLPDIDDPILKERLESLGQAVMNKPQNK
jgi:hypothetical protein